MSLKLLASLVNHDAHDLAIQPPTVAQIYPCLQVYQTFVEHVSSHPRRSSNASRHASKAPYFHFSRSDLRD